jgi:hypothetical protein
MNQGATDQEEWQKDENWGGPKWGEVYFSKKDRNHSAYFMFILPPT